MNGDKSVRGVLALILVLTILLWSGTQAEAAASRLLGGTSVAAEELLHPPAQREYIVDTAGMISSEDAARTSKAMRTSCSAAGASATRR